MRNAKRWICSLAVVAMLAASSAHAVVSGDEVQLVGTTIVGPKAHSSGHIDVTAPGTMIFRVASEPGKPAVPDLVMPYDKVFEFGLTSEDAFHLGFFPAMFYGMVAPRPQRHIFTVSWHDANGDGQEATFEISKGLGEHLIPVMYARARSACVRREFGSCSPVVPPPPPPRVRLTGPAAASSAAQP